ncbi:phenoloxidase-activating factor 2-like [Wyeomyia smithii]|uniref:phenoloxidase-activating factor 2-like n=1 Tax=Wyeomyia smithii TaxID=174621 RepID=UPI0024680F24|nr:phenoloxidase-activating factor 2-like [Wyeomyia smithii]
MQRLYKCILIMLCCLLHEIRSNDNDEVVSCSTSEIEDGVCVSPHLCNDGSLNTDGKGLVDLRFGDICEDYLKKCCTKRTRCADDNGLCIPEANCGVNLNDANYTQFKQYSNDCISSDYKCCPHKYVDKKKPPAAVLPTKAEDGCNTVGGRCVPQNQCSSKMSINIRISPCESDGYVCCTVEDSNTNDISTSGKVCVNGLGKCTLTSNCNGTQIKDSKNECEGLVCCQSIEPYSAESEITKTPPTEIPPTEMPASSSTCPDNGGICRSEENCVRKTDEPFEDCEETQVCCLEKKPTPDYEARACGYRNMGGIHFSITGDEDGESQYGEFPWTVAIFDDMKFEKKFICGGALIDPGVVLTTADCLKSYRNKPEKLIVRAGEWDMRSLSEPEPYEERTVQLLKIHPDFKPTSLVNNIGLMFLTDGFDFKNTIESICLPPEDLEIDNGYVTATGWGVTPTNRNDSQKILKKLELSYKEHLECERILRSVLRNSQFRLHDSFLCAGGEPMVDTCRGDAGSPVIFPVPDDFNDRYYLVGMVSWGIGCGRQGVPAAYTAVAKFRNWIDAQMEEQQLRDSYYFYQKEEAK